MVGCNLGMCFRAMHFILQIETQKLNFKEKAQSKVGSKDNIQHKPSGGERKVGASVIIIIITLIFI